VTLSLRNLALELGFNWSTFKQWLDSLGNYRALPEEVLIALAVIRRIGIALYTFPINADIPWLYLLTNVYRVIEVAKVLEHLKNMGVNTSKILIILDAGVER
jgi:hypothetical protein